MQLLVSRIALSLSLMLSTMTLVSVAHAADIALILAGGVRSNSATTDLPNASVTNRTSFSGGLLGIAPINGHFVLRSGFLITQRYVDLGPTTQGTVDINFAYVDVPLTPMILLTNEAGVFAGPVIAMNVIKDCTASLTTCGATNVKSVIVPWTVGVQARFFGQFGGEIFYEKVFGDAADNVSNFTTVGGNILFYFD